MLCIAGHPILANEGQCEQGHARAVPPAAEGQTPIEQMQAMMQQMMSMHQENMGVRTNMQEGQSSGSMVKPERPVVKASSTDGDWSLFLDSWKRYKDMTNLRDVARIRNELRCACTQEVNKLLFDLIGPEVLNAETEEGLLAHIKSVAVHGSHKEVHRQKFQALRQAEGESVTHYLARLKAQAQLCEFFVQCPTPNCTTPVSYGNDMVSGRLVAGLLNSDHQARVLAEAATLDTLQRKFDRLVSLETTDRATSRLNTTVASSAPSISAAQKHKSDYRKQRSHKPNVCNSCGRSSHRGKAISKAPCPALNVACHQCGLQGHFRSMCPKGSTHSSAANATEQIAIDEPTTAELSYIFACESTQVEEVAPIPHMEWNGSEFDQRSPAKPPRITVMISIADQALATLVPVEATPDHPHIVTSLVALADSGAQTCSSSIDILAALGYPESALIPTSHRIHGITDTNLDIAGTLPLLIEKDGHQSVQIVYVSRNVKGFFLSETALKELSLIPQHFPTIMCAAEET